MSARTFHRLACSPWRLTPRCPPRQSPPLHSDHEIEHLTEPWLEMVVLDQLVVQLEYNGQYVEEQSARERASSPASSMETPAPAEEARADAVVDALVADAPEADAPASASADSESEVEADADTVRPRAAAAWAAGLCPSGGAPPSEAELDGALRARARRLARGPVHP